MKRRAGTEVDRRNNIDLASGRGRERDTEGHGLEFDASDSQAAIILNGNAVHAGRRDHHIGRRRDIALKCHIPGTNPGRINDGAAGICAVGDLNRDAVNRQIQPGGDIDRLLNRQKGPTRGIGKSVVAVVAVRAHIIRCGSR